MWAQNGPECAHLHNAQSADSLRTQVWMFDCEEKLRLCASFYALKGFDANNLKLGRKDWRGLYSHLSADENVYFKSRHKSGFCLATQNKSWVSKNKWKQKANQSICKLWSQIKATFTDYQPSMKSRLSLDIMVLFPKSPSGCLRYCSKTFHQYRLHSCYKNVFKTGYLKLQTNCFMMTFWCLERF